MFTKATIRDLERFTSAYLEAMLWSSIDDDGNPLDQGYTLDDLDPGSKERSKADCATFICHVDHELNGKYEQAGHDFWLTRNRHGSGFWDGDWGKERGERLTKASHAFPEQSLYVGDNGMIYLQ